MRHGVIVLVVVGFFLVGPSVAESDPPPEGAETIKLAVLGGPPAGRVTITINEEFALEFDEEPPAITEIADLLRAGENTMEIRVEAPDVPREGGEAQIFIAPWQAVSRTQRESGEPLARIVMPAEAPAEPCTQTVRFWLGSPEVSPELSTRYWIVADGPPSPVWVTVSINGRPVMSTNEGSTFIDVTPHVQPGRNDVEYAAVPTCLARPTARTGDLTFSVTTGEKNQDVVEMTAPMAVFSVNPRAKPKERTKTLGFRGR